ncbi:MAG: ABC transporter ATP-binding protein [Rhodoferax sp.]|nr:ABC transporter ATP-binding protein [Rhodoferax sp.]
MGTITVSNLGKAYKQYFSRWARLAEWVLPGNRVRHHVKWVLQDISFKVNPGEAVGIIGVNGAGKSTLLKMITGTTLPTNGSVTMTGRVAAMLELGMGFHPDFTGRQNAYMAGQLLGYGVDEITRLMPEIEAFAEIGDYIDQPVRVYSSGMQMRLAFSVATAHRPDILIVDEALSVGDDYFVHKSFSRIRQFRELGTTLLIVSHDKAAIQSICDRAILINAGRLAMEGSPEAVMDYYNALIAERENNTVQQVVTDTGQVQTTSGTGEATVRSVKLMNQAGEAIEVVNVGQTVTLSIEVESRADLPEVVLGYMIKDRLGQPVFGTNTHHMQRVWEDVPQGALQTYLFSFDANLGQGTYSLATSLHADENHLGKNYEWRDLALVFNVINMDKTSFIGTAWMPPTLEFRP